METPVYDFAVRYAGLGAVRMHMPGHKGALAALGGAALDITEIPGADSLYDAGGILAQSEASCAALFGADTTLFSAGGSTLCIQAMLALAAAPGGTVIAARNAHRAFLSACALLDLDVHWMASPPGSILSGGITAGAVKEAIAACPHAAAIYLTSPDYLGGMCDIEAIARVCHGGGKLLLVDNAHGAHLRFCEPDLHPITLGADLCTDGAHKTLPVLTGGAYLHIAGRAKRLAPGAKQAMALFGSTSPSYLILASLDLCNAYLAGEGAKSIRAVQALSAGLREALAARGLCVADTDPMHITLTPRGRGYTGTALADYLRARGVELEYADDAYAVALLGAVSAEGEVSRLREAVLALPLLPPLPPLPAPELPVPERAMRIREAVFAPREYLPVGKCAGRVCAEVKSACPPGVPIAAPGEVISPQMIKILQMYSINGLNVVK